MKYLVASPRQAEIDQQAYALALEYLFALDVPELTREVIETYGRPFTAKISRPATLAQVYLHFLVSAQNANMKPGVIGGAIGGVDKLSVVLCDFELGAVVEKYDANSDRLLQDIVDQLLQKREIRRTAKSIWPQYCRVCSLSARSSSLSLARLKPSTNGSIHSIARTSGVPHCRCC